MKTKTSSKNKIVTRKYGNGTKVTTVPTGAQQLTIKSAKHNGHMWMYAFWETDMRGGEDYLTVCKRTKLDMRQPVYIDIFRLNRVMGKSSHWSMLGLADNQIEDLNEIGYSGKFRNEQMTIQTYLNEYVADEYTAYQVYQESTNGEFSEVLLVVKCEIKNK